MNDDVSWAQVAGRDEMPSNRWDCNIEVGIRKRRVAVRAAHSSAYKNQEWAGIQTALRLLQSTLVLVQLELAITLSIQSEQNYFSKLRSFRKLFTTRNSIYLNNPGVFGLIMWWDAEKPLFQNKCVGKKRTWKGLFEDVRCLEKWDFLTASEKSVEPCVKPPPQKASKCFTTGLAVCLSELVKKKKHSRLWHRKGGEKKKNPRLVEWDKVNRYTDR